MAREDEKLNKSGQSVNQRLGQEAGKQAGGQHDETAIKRGQSSATGYGSQAGSSGRDTLEQGGRTNMERQGSLKGGLSDEEE